ncbi:hypothetical protein D1007_26006 [Hordeum vulgare]|nr:hypothetical protein D1007_26006 [Hordeum vulgare]
MVYEDESNNDLSSLLYISSFSDDMQYQPPASIDDHDYVGVETAPLVPCKQHGVAAERRVAFKGFETGRRFLMCANKVRC